MLDKGLTGGIDKGNRWEDRMGGLAGELEERDLMRAFDERFD